MVRFMCAAALFAATLICVNGWIESVWAASLNNQNSEFYLDRASTFLVLAVLLVSAGVLLLCWNRASAWLHSALLRRHSHVRERY